MAVHPSSCWGQKPWNHPWFFSFIPHNQSISESSQVNSQYESTIWPFLTTFTASTLVWATIISLVLSQYTPWLHLSPLWSLLNTMARLMLIKPNYITLQFQPSNSLPFHVFSPFFLLWSSIHNTKFTILTVIDLWTAWELGALTLCTVENLDVI